MSDDPVVEHFFSSNDVDARVFIELCLASVSHRQGRDIETLNETIQELNDLFLEVGYAFELTPFVDSRPPRGVDDDGRPTHSPPKFPRGGIPSDPPKFIPRSDGLLQDEVIAPCLSVLSETRFSVANEEFRGALAHYREGRISDAVTAFGSAFESVLKTTCDSKGWPYDPDKDTCSTLVDICKTQGLFPGFYVGVLKSTSTIRNKLGDAHGRGPRPLYSVSKTNLEHLFHLTAANILLVVRLADSMP